MVLPALRRGALPVAFAFLLLLALLGVAMPATAGTATDPDITDKANDQAVEGAVPITTQPPAGTTVGLNADLIAAWITPQAADGLTLTIQVQGSGSPTTSSTTTYDFHLETGGNAYDAKATMDPANAAAGVPGSGTIKPGGVASSASAAGDHLIVLTVPLANVGNPGPGAMLTNLFVTSEAKQGGAVPQTITDRAPDSGAGRSVTLVGANAAKTVRGTLTNTTVSVTQAFTNATTSLYLYNWTQGPASASLHLHVAGTGNLTVLVRDSSNATVFQDRVVPISTTSNFTAKAGTWRLSLNYTGFKGNVTLAIVPWTPPATTSPTSTPAATGASHSTTSGGGSGTGGSSTSKTPAPGVPLAVALLGTLAILRRRRAA